ncbi:MAG: hypothetical protein ACLTYW_04430 [Collinsella sp.]
MVLEESPHVVETFVTHEGLVALSTSMGWTSTGRAHAEHLVCRL